ERADSIILAGGGAISCPSVQGLSQCRGIAIKVIPVIVADLWPTDLVFKSPNGILQCRVGISVIIITKASNGTIQGTCKKGVVQQLRCTAHRIGSIRRTACAA